MGTEYVMLSTAERLEVTDHLFQLLMQAQHDTRPRTEAADATRAHETVDTEAHTQQGQGETISTHTDNNNNNNNKGNKRE